MARDFLSRVNMKPGVTNATVSLTLEVATAAWGPDCTIAQVVAQSIEDAELQVRNLISQRPSVRLVAIEGVCVTSHAASGSPPRATGLDERHVSAGCSDPLSALEAWLEGCRDLVDNKSPRYQVLTETLTELRRLRALWHP